MASHGAAGLERPTIGGRQADVAARRRRRRWRQEARRRPADRRQPHARHEEAATQRRRLRTGLFGQLELELRRGRVHTEAVGAAADRRQFRFEFESAGQARRTPAPPPRRAQEAGQEEGFEEPSESAGRGGELVHQQAGGQQGQFEGEDDAGVGC